MGESLSLKVPSSSPVQPYRVVPMTQYPPVLPMNQVPKTPTSVRSSVRISPSRRVGKENGWNLTALAFVAVSFWSLAPANAQEIVTLSTETPPTAKNVSPVSTNSIPDKNPIPDKEKPIQDEARSLSQAFRQAARRASPSVVTVFSYGQNSNTPSEESSEDEEGFEEIPPGDESLGPAPPTTSADDGLPLTGLGSGVIVDLGLSTTTDVARDATGGLFVHWVMTNNHVIADAQRVVVQLPDETELTAAAVFGDPDSDVAVVRLETKQPLSTATLGDSDKLEIGDWVLAIGSPFKLEATVSAGIISAKNRALKRIRRGRLLQTDAAINPGNSGGPLVNLDGDVIAINTAIATRNGGYQGIGFAIPVNQSRWISRELAQHERVRRAAMGIRLAELNPKVAKKLDLPVYLGVLVYQVISDSAADRAGLKSLDVILEFAGQRVRKPGALQEAVERQPIGSTQPIKIYRQGKELMKEIVLAPLEDPTATNP